MEGNVAGSTLKTCNYMEGASSVTKDPESTFAPIGIRKGCFKFGQHVIYNNGELNRVQASCLDMVQTLTIWSQFWVNLDWSMNISVLIEMTILKWIHLQQLMAIYQSFKNTANGALPTKGIHSISAQLWCLIHMILQRNDWKCSKKLSNLYQLWPHSNFEFFQFI